MPYSFVDKANQNIGAEKSPSREEGDPVLTATGVMREHPGIGSAAVAAERRHQIMEGDLDPKCIK